MREESKMTDWRLVHSYSRREAILDGVLVDVSERAKDHGFKIPVAMTDAAYQSAVLWTALDDQKFKGEGQSNEGRLHDVLSMAYRAVLASSQAGTDTCIFPLLRIDRAGRSRKPTRLDLKVVIGPGDDAEPVLTIMLIGED
jgi:hypothetical protein